MQSLAPLTNMQHGESFQPTSTFDQSAANHLLSPQNLAYGAMQPPHWLPPSHISGLVPQGQNTFGHVQLFSDQPITALNPDTTAHTDGPELETATDCEEQLVGSIMQYILVQC